MKLQKNKKWRKKVMLVVCSYAPFSSAQSKNSSSSLESTENVSDEAMMMKMKCMMPKPKQVGIGRSETTKQSFDSTIYLHHSNITTQAQEELL